MKAIIVTKQGTKMEHEVISVVITPCVIHLVYKLKDPMRAISADMATDTRYSQRGIASMVIEDD